MTRIRHRALSQQLKDEKSKPEGLAVLEEDFDCAEAIEFEVQRRLKSATEDFDNEVYNLQVQLSASNQSFRDEKKQLERRVEELQSELSVAENRCNELKNVLESIAKVTTGQRYDYHQNIKALNQENAQEREWIRRQDRYLKRKDRELTSSRDELLKANTEKDLIQQRHEITSERIKRQDEDLLSKDREIEKMNKEKEKEKERRKEIIRER